MSINNLTVTEVEGSKPIPEGLYKAYIKELKDGKGEFGDYVKVVFEIAEGDYKTTIRTMVASLKLTKSKSGKNSKLFDLLKAIMKIEPKPGDNFDLTQLIGKTCQILVVNGKNVEGTQYQDIS